MRKESREGKLNTVWAYSKAMEMRECKPILRIFVSMSSFLRKALLEGLFATRNVQVSPFFKDARVLLLKQPDRLKETPTHPFFILLHNEAKRVEVIKYY